MVRAWQRAVIGGTELRLVVTAGIVLRVLGLRGLDRQVSVYPSLDAAAAARLPAAGAVLAASETDRLDDLAALARDAAAARREHLELLDAVITGLFAAGLDLRAAEGLPTDAARRRTREIAGELDGIIRLIRAAAFTQPAQPGTPSARVSEDDR